MADEKVYGIAESKSRVEVPRKSDTYDKSEVYTKSQTYSKAETYSKTESDILFYNHETGTPKNHQTSEPTYGLGTNLMFGHCMLVNSYDTPPTGNQDGKALSAAAGYALKQYIDAAVAQINATISQINTTVAAVNSKAELAKVTIGECILFSEYYSNMDTFAQKIGYGKWVYVGSITSDNLPSPKFVYMRVTP